MLDTVQDYYGKVLQNSDDLQTDACCTDAGLPTHIKAALSDIHDEVMARYYGCGLIAPEALEGLSILDLGSGSGRDAFVLSRLVGENGLVVGVDMTEEQLEVANRHVDYHRQKFGYSASNVRFIKGYLEDLGNLGLLENSFDLIVSNCVINLCTDKAGVLQQAYRLLKPGGEMYFSDVYADRRVPADLAQDPVLYGECLSGALYWNDFEHLARRAGFTDPRLVTDRPLAINNPEIAEKLDGIGFFSATYRLFKCDDLEAARENYGQTATYDGTITHQPDALWFDKDLRFETGEEVEICGNTARMLRASRLGSHFTIKGGFEHHHGLFASGRATGIPFDRDIPAQDVSSCCG